MTIWILSVSPSTSEQDAEKGRQHRSRIVQTLNVPQGYASDLHSLRPCWTAFLIILREYSTLAPKVQTTASLKC